MLTVGDQSCLWTATITLEERRCCDGLDRYVPRILRNGTLYDVHLDRFFLDLPLNGARSRHTLRAYGYDIVVWVRFLAQARGKDVWKAERLDVAAFHRSRRRGEAHTRVSAASWNRAIASLDKLYRWGKEQRLISSSPFNHRSVWRRSHGVGRARIAQRNDSYERVAKRSDVRFISVEDYRIFRDVGLRGLAPDGREREGARDRNGARNALFADLLITTGLRLQEASLLMAFEAVDVVLQAASQVWFELPMALTKGMRGRSILMPRRLIREVTDYAAVERVAAVTKFRQRRGWEAIEQPIYIFRPRAGARTFQRCSGESIDVQTLTPEERSRVVICNAQGDPLESAVLWLTEVGQPVRPNSWEVAFDRASRRCGGAGFPIRVNPHQLRHSFAVHMLALLERRTFM